ncbi:hypothetical protein K505DRAFT_95591 [Melanomma pulvis-pyrius CBS 109.77]|uniref:Uncharacterized protein n=1 Tax=Melanomma pulvis-pyrius CBS 109.77 TaxID=1314802 RepID=A0A6A6WZ12_9PLEO|nr:hypothetical protein K505DRAFT_95591 [Melanomma pulvis-pyrius CBS 109.77]
MRIPPRLARMPFFSLELFCYSRPHRLRPAYLLLLILVLHTRCKLVPRLERGAVAAAPVRRRGSGLTRTFLRFKAGLQQERLIETEVFSDGKDLMVVVCTRGGAQTGQDMISVILDLTEQADVYINQSLGPID